MVKILTDSAADLPKDIIEEYDIDVVPLIVYLDQQEFLDGETIVPKDLFEGMRNEKVYRTAQVSAAFFNEKFTSYAEQGGSYIYIAFSSGLSGTYQTGELVKQQVMDKYPDFDLEIVDTQSASLGFGLTVVQAARMAKEGGTKEEILETINFYINHMEHIFTVDDLDYLLRGGRVSKTAAFVGGLLNIKPILDVEEGKLIPLEKIRGRKKVFKRMLEIMEERGDNLSEQLIAISHGDDLEGAEQLRDLIKDKFGCSNFLINTIGAAIGAHAGPGTIALFFLNKTR